MAKLTAEMMKVHLAHEMADYRMEHDPNGQDRYFWIDYYHQMRDFDLLNLWLECCGDKMITNLNILNYN